MVLPHPKCAGCPLAPSALGFCPPQPIEAHTKLVVFGEAPGRTEAESSYGFTGASGKLLREWLRRAGLQVASAWGSDMPRPGRIEDVAFSNCVLCVRPKNQYPSIDAALECYRRHQPHLLEKDLETSPRGYGSMTPWVAYGANAIETLTGFRLPIQKTRGSWLPVRREIAKNQWLVSALHPAFLVRGGRDDNPGGEDGKGQDTLKPTLGVDARRAMEVSTPRVPIARYLQDPSELPEYPNEGDLVSVDIEGANGRPSIVGVAWKENLGYVFPWSSSLRDWLSNLFAGPYMACGYNCNYDIPELEAAGVRPPKVWWDGINLAALYEPDLPKNLQTQTLTHVPGSITWKGLVSHEHGPDYVGGSVAVYRDLWTTVLTRLGMDVPTTGLGWFVRYNCNDVCYTLSLINQLKRKLISQGRWDYYLTVLQPLQRPLLEIGARGMPVDEARVAEHKATCAVKIAEATATLVAAGAAMLADKAALLRCATLELETAREIERLQGIRKFTKAKELTALRGKIKTLEKGFNPDSAPQRAALLYEYYGLPPIKNKGAKGFTSDDTAVGDLINRLERGTIKPKVGTKDEVLPVLRAMIEVKRWGVLESTFLRPELV